MKTKTYQLRSWKSGDEESLVEHANNRNVWINLRDIFPHPYTQRDAYEWINFAKDQNLIKAIEVEGKAVGGIGLYIKDDIYARNAEIGYWLGEAFWGKGIVSEAVKEMVALAFKNQQIHRIYASVFAHNKTSMHILAKAGFKEESILKESVLKDGKFVDEHIWALLRNEFEKML